ncbi:hypothetical protein B1L11_01515 [Microbispora sp. GKU 823]|nr:hypothetical protein B1L11_01515 [Microbispora sp. GKU 823]
MLLNPVAALAVRLLAETWRGRPVAALRRFAAALPVSPGPGAADRGRTTAADRAATRDIAVTFWIVAARAWQATAALMPVPNAAGAPLAAVACLAVPVGLLRLRTAGVPRPPHDRWLAVALTAPAVAALCAAAAGAAEALGGPDPAVVALWRCAWGALALGAAAFAVRAARAWLRGGPGPWRASLVPSESCGTRIPGDLTPSTGLSEEVRHAAAYSRNVVLACTGADGPRALAVSAVTSVTPAGEFRLIAGDEAWDAVRRDPRVVLFVGDPRFWAEVRGVAVPDDDVLRVTPRQVLMREYPGRHQARTTR